MQHVNTFSLVPKKGKKPFIASEDDLAALLNRAPWAPKLFLPEELKAATKNEEVSKEALLTGFDMAKAIEQFLCDPKKSDAENDAAKNKAQEALSLPESARSDLVHTHLKRCEDSHIHHQRRDQQRMFLAFVTHTKMRGHNSSHDKPTMFRDKINTAITFFHLLSKIAMTDKLKVAASEARVNSNSKSKCRIKAFVTNTFMQIAVSSVDNSMLCAYSICERGSTL